MNKIVVLAGLLVALLVAGCGGGTPAGQPPQRTLTVSAAASLTGTFDQLKTQFEAQHPGVTVKINYGGSSDLAQQIVGGAPVDVFAGANTSTMDTVTKANLASGAPQVFVTNRLQIAVAPDNPKHIAAFADLAKPGTVVIVCAPQVPCGAAAQKVEQATGVAVAPASEESDVKSVLSKVQTGNADAGLVYVTDVRSAAGKVTGVDFPEAAKALNTYPIVVLRNAPQADLAQQFLALVTGAAGRAVFSQAGFGTP